MVTRKALGKGLGALIPGINESSNTSPDQMFLINIEEVTQNPHQPRKIFNKLKLDELTDSIKENGIIQPLLVKKLQSGYELIAGERRWLAAQKAGLTRVPIVVKEVDEKGLLELSLIENIQREDLNVIEEAEAYQKLIEFFNYTQDEAAKRVGKSRTTITNSLRLLKLHKKIKEDLLQNKITMGHARAYLGLASLSQQLEVHTQVLRKNLSVRQAEQLIQKMKKRTKPRKSLSQSIQNEFLIDELRKRLGTQVKILQQGKKGKIIIEFYSKEEFERIFDLLKGNE